MPAILTVYPAEQEAGLAEAIAKSVARVQAPACLAPAASDLQALVDKLTKANRSEGDSLLAGLGNRQPDLAYLVSILVSTGWNLNDDVFDPAETFAARETPVNKPINVGHDEGFIVGHMVRSRAVDKKGTPVEGDPPAEFDLETAGVLYKDLPALSETVAAILDKATKGELFVSMEVWFSDFGYAIKDKASGESRVVARTADNAFLTKHLRAYGGTGEYDGFRVGRVLRNLVFAGKGIVTSPANPDSVIKEVAKVSASSAHQEGGTKDMAAEKSPEELCAEVTRLQAQAAEKDAALQAAVDAHKATVAEWEAKTVALQAQVDASATAKAELEKQVAEVTKRAETAQAELHKIAKATKARERLEALAAVKTITDAKATLAELAEMTDETFAFVLKYAKVEAKPAEEVKPTPAAASTTTTVEAADAAALDDVEPEDEPDLQVSTGTQAESLARVAKATAERLLGCPSSDGAGSDN